MCSNTRFLFDVPFIPIDQSVCRINVDKDRINKFITDKNKEISWIGPALLVIANEDFKDLLRKFQYVVNNHSINPLILSEINQIIQTINYNSDSNLINEAISVVSEYIDQQNQASRLIFETPSLNAHIIGSVDTITGFYTSIVECFEEIIFKKLDQNSKWSIFTTINHSTTIDSYQYFPDSIAKENQKRQELIAIFIEKQYFFKLKYCIPYLIHEIGHYLPPLADQSSRTSQSFYKRDYW